MTYSGRLVAAAAGLAALLAIGGCVPDGGESFDGGGGSSATAGTGGSAVTTGAAGTTGTGGNAGAVGAGGTAGSAVGAGGVDGSGSGGSSGAAGTGGAVGTGGTGGATGGAAGSTGGNAGRDGTGGAAGNAGSGGAGRGGTGGSASGTGGSTAGRGGTGGATAGTGGGTGQAGRGGTTGTAGAAGSVAGRGGTTGAAGRGGTTGTAGAGGGGDTWLPCDGSTSGYDAVVSLSGGTWTARRGTTTAYTGSDMAAAMQAGINSLTSGRTTKQSVLVMGSGSMSANTRVSVASYTVLNVCGTINVTGTGSGDQAPIYARGQRDIDVPHATITGAPLYGMFFRQVDNIHLGRIDMRLSSGLGVRVDNGSDHPPTKSRNFRLDYIYVENSGTHGVETYGIDGITIGTVIARSTTDAGLLLNDSINAEVGLVDADDAATGTGYAAFRVANRNGRINNAYPTNIHVGQVISRGGGRGIFCVSESGGLVIDRIDIQNAGNNAILLENCYNVNIAAVSGTVSGGGEIRVAARTEFPNSSDITIQNLTVSNVRINENPCADGNSTIRNITPASAVSSSCP